MSQPKVRLLIVLLGLGVIAALFYGLQTPAYALYRIHQAIDRRDLATFYSYIDLPKVINSIKDAENTRRQQTASDWQTLASAIETQVSKVLSSQQLHLVRREIEGKFRNAKLPSPPDAAFGDLLATRNFLLDAKGYKIGSVARRGKSALANLEVNLPRLNKTYTLLLVLEKDGPWRIIGLEGLASTLDEYAQDQQHYVRTHNEQVHRKLAQSLECSTTARYETTLMGLSRTLLLQVRCRNLFPDTITALAGDITLKSPQGTVLKKFPLGLSSIAWKSGDFITMNQEEKIGLIEGGIAEALTTPTLLVSFAAKEVKFSTGHVLRPVSAYENVQ